MKVACILEQATYKPGDQAPEGYLEWHEWAEVQHKAGLRQKQCGRCGLWRYPQQLSAEVDRAEMVMTRKRKSRRVTVETPVCNDCHKPPNLLADQHVWHNPRTSSAWETDAQIRKTLWEPMLKRAGVRYRNPYQVRHTYASAQLTAGANPWWVAQQLGHVDVEMVFRTYGKFIPQDYAKPKATRLRVVAASTAKDTL